MRTEPSMSVAGHLIDSPTPGIEKAFLWFHNHQVPVDQVGIHTLMEGTVIELSHRHAIPLPVIRRSSVHGIDEGSF